MITKRLDKLSDERYTFYQPFSDDIQHCVTNYMPDLEDAGVTGIVALIEDGDFVELWYCTQRISYLLSATYELYEDIRT